MHLHRITSVTIFLHLLQIRSVCLKNSATAGSITFMDSLLILILLYTRGADKPLARPGRKQATTTKLLQATQKKKIRRLSVQPGIRGSYDLHVGRKVATFQLFFQSGRAKDLSEPL